MGEANKIRYHKLVRGAVEEALAYYGCISPNLANAFREELASSVAAAAAQPLRFHPVSEFRRINLKRFPYHVLFKCDAQVIRIMVVKHNKRHPNFGVFKS